MGRGGGHRNVVRKEDGGGRREGAKGGGDGISLGQQPYDVPVVVAPLVVVLV